MKTCILFPLRATATERGDPRRRRHDRRADRGAGLQQHGTRTGRAGCRGDAAERPAERCAAETRKKSAFASRGGPGPRSSGLASFASFSPKRGGEHAAHLAVDGRRPTIRLVADGASSEDAGRKHAGLAYAVFEAESDADACRAAAVVMDERTKSAMERLQKVDEALKGVVAPLVRPQPAMESRLQ